MIPFPQRIEQGANDLEQVIRKWLKEISADADFINHVTERMLVFINQYACQTFEPVFNLPAPAAMTEGEATAMLTAIQAGVDLAAGQVQEMMNKIIIDRFFLEVHIYELQKNNNKTWFRGTR